ncbi:uncharacterized protein LOC126579716 [Anopheles aquasalis]|uniref:uncharacterized protein LOC126579716 n=1 Tax=Anopheles aquasalis TaxID=42839 RepID=UPI00215AB6D9|nr:uncharacterized protein LOC126579716 [Anopheles aquasalis]
MAPMKVVLLVVNLALLVLCQRADREPGPLLLLRTDDILNEHLMPLTLLMLDAPDGAQGEGAAESRTMDHGPLPFRFEPSGSGSGDSVVHTNETSYSRALSTMEFHRTMFNRYRCNGFLANRILHQAYQPGVLTKRMSSASDGTVLPSVSNALLYDPGSSGYREWLTKTATMDDIYRNYLSVGGVADAVAGDEQHPRHRTPAAAASDKVGIEKEPTEQQEQDLGFDEGFVTGYAGVPTTTGGGGGRYHPASDSYRQHHRTKPSQGRHWELLEGETESGYARGDMLYSGIPGAPHYHHHQSVFESEHQPQEKQLASKHPVAGGSVGLKDLFDIALTTLAFLSFGMFILQVIMCITMTKGEAGMMVLPTQPIEVEVDGGEVRRERFMRELPTEPAPVAVRELNQLAGHALSSIDVLVMAGDVDVGSVERAACLQRSLCVANRFSRTLTTISGYWVSLWSLAVCWMAGVTERPPPSAPVALHCLSASIVGIGNGNCSKLYPCPAARSSI